MLWLDLETRSQCNLIASGLMAYAIDTTTEVICMSYAFGDEDIKTWFAEDKKEFPQEIIEYIRKGGILTAHNAQFERYLFDYVIGNDYKFKPPTLEQWHCSSAQAMAHGLPGALSDVCKAMSIPMQKQSEGRRLIRDYCAPGFKTSWCNDDKKLMEDYCVMDVATMRQFCSCLRELSEEEWGQYHATERMNSRGVPIDLPFVTAALNYSVEVKADVDSKIFKLTYGAVINARKRKDRDAWLMPLLTEHQRKILEVVKNGITKTSLDKEHQNYLLACNDLHPQAEKLLMLLADAGGSASSKFKAMFNTQVENRCFNSMVFSGAGATGRYSSRGIQFQNMKRDVYDDPEPLINDVLNNIQIENPADSLGRLTRSAITSKDGLTYSDYSQIEARVLPWLANSVEAEKTLDIFREGRDLYSENAVGMFGLKDISEVTKDLRQSSKTATLACGFAGGFRALLAMAKIYGLTMSEDEARDNVSKWRSANAWAEPLWYGLKDAGHDAVKYPNEVRTFGRISFLYDGADWLWMMLPSGRCLAYFKPKFEMVSYPWGDEGIELTFLWGSGRPKAGEKWPRQTVSPITFVQHATQATAADVMRETIVRADKENLKTLFSVHDELIVEGYCFDTLHAVMETPPGWATGLPISADTQINKRYGK